ncbi:hypothetical protein BH10BDE1_BH10BDE1_26460 [soil metagenome]
MAKENNDREPVRRSGSKDQPDRSFTSQKETPSADKEAPNSGGLESRGGSIEADDELARDSANRESTAKKPF